MKTEEVYLSDEELDFLISEIEQNELVSVPSDFANKVLEKITEQQEERVPRWSATRDKKIEFQKYCIRVITSVAAAIAIVFFLPEIEVAKARSIPTRTEMIGENIAREDILNDENIMEKVSSKINEKIGGIFNETEKKE